MIKHVLSTPSLSSQFQIRAVTRDPSASSSRALLLLPPLSSQEHQVEVVQGDVSDPASLLAALRDVHTVFAMTAHDPALAPNAEFLAGKAIADAAVSAGAKCLIWSTLPSVSLQTGGKYTLLAPFDDKFAVENYIRDELYHKDKIQAAFLLPASFMENFGAFMPPRFDPKRGKWVLRRPNSAESKLALIAAVEDVGKFVGSILAEPQKYAGRTVNAAQGRYSYREVAEAIAKGAGKEKEAVVYEEIGEEEFKREIGGGIIGDGFFQLYRYFEEYGLYGDHEEEAVRRAGEDVRGGKEVLMGLQEFFVKYPLKLE